MRRKLARRAWLKPLAAAAVGAGFIASRPVSAEIAAAERLPATPPITGWVWTVLVPVLLFLVSFFAAYALYRRFSSK